MTRDKEPMDITNMPELLRIAEEVGRSKQPLQLKEHDKIVAVVMPPQGTTSALSDEHVRQTKSNLRKHFGSVRPHQQPEDFSALRQEFEEGVAEDARTRGQQHP